MKKYPLVSIIIPTFNSEADLASCLESIKKQPYKNVEVIVVDQSSTDKTPNIAQRYDARVISIKRPKFYSPPGQSRNIGFEKSKGEILMHIDSDMRVSMGLVEEVAAKLQSEKIGAVIIHELDDTRGFWSKCKSLERRCYWGNLNYESARAVRRDIFQKVGGYDPEIESGEDMVIQKKYEEITEIGFCENVLHHNLTELHFIRMMQKKFSYGKTSQKYFSKNDVNPAVFFIEEFRCYFKNYRLLLRNPIVSCGMIFLKISEIFFGGLGFVKTKLT